MLEPASESFILQMGAPHGAGFAHARRGPLRSILLIHAGYSSPLTTVFSAVKTAEVISWKPTKGFSNGYLSETV